MNSIAYTGSVLLALCFTLSASQTAVGNTFVVDNLVANASDANPGTEQLPLKTIQAGANLAQPGDTVLVRQGIYREEVVPPRGGSSADKSITYLAPPGAKVSIRGSEQITSWSDQGNGIWMVELDTSFFKGYNPFARVVWGKWLGRGSGHRLGDVYLNGEALRQKMKMEELRTTPKTWYVDGRYGYKNKTEWPEERKYPGDKIKIWANFGKLNPNKNMAEINARATCLFPEKTGLKYIVLDGFDVRHAAPQWGDIYTLEKGAIGMKYGYRWTIQNCTITDSRNIGISMGVTDEIRFSDILVEGGCNIPSIETMGHHVIRNNVIRCCGQCGIYGCYGAIGSVIEGNLISETNYRSEWFGSNQAAIKILFPIDVVIRDNLLIGMAGVKTNAKGIWLDWGTQNARVTGNVISDFDGNAGSTGLFLEVNFGPIIVDNNIFVRSKIAVESNGAILVNNLFSDCSFSFWANPKRTTPYYKPHSTVRTGKTAVTLAHIRIFNNIISGGIGFNSDKVLSKGNDPSGIDSNDNIFLHGAGGFSNKDGRSIVDPASADIVLDEKDGRWTLGMNLPETVLEGRHLQVTSKLIGTIPLAEMPMETQDGKLLDITSDLFGKPIDSKNVLPGPIQVIRPGRNQFKVWPKSNLISMDNCIAEKDASATEPPHPQALEHATIKLDQLNSPLDYALILGNGETTGLLWSQGKTLNLRITKNDAWDARYDTSQDPEPINISRIRALGKTDWLIDKNFYAGHINPDGSPYTGHYGWRNPYPCPVMCADIWIGPSPIEKQPAWRPVREEGTTHTWHRQDSAAVMTIAGHPGDSCGYAQALVNPQAGDYSQLKIKLSGTPNAEFFVQTQNNWYLSSFTSKWQKSPAEPTEITFDLPSKAETDHIMVYTKTTDGKVAANRIESVQLIGKAGTYNADLTYPDETPFTSAATLDIRKAVATVAGSKHPDGIQPATVRALANHNAYLIQSKTKPQLSAPKVHFLPEPTIVAQGAVSYLHQKLPPDKAGDWPGMEYAVALASKNEQHVVAIVTSFESKDVIADACKLAQTLLAQNIDQLIAEHESRWSTFWAASGINIVDDFLADTWYRNLYFFRCISKPGTQCPGLYAGMTEPIAKWHGGHTLNYNIQQTYWTPLAANHVDLAEPYTRMINSYRPRARWLCKQVYECDGALYPHNIFTHESPDPKTCKSNLGRQFFHMTWSYTLGTSGFVVQNLWLNYKYAPDKKFLKTIVYPAIKEVATLYVDFVEHCDASDDGRIILAPSVSPEHHGWTHKFKYNKNVTFDIAMVHYTLAAAIEGANTLGVDKEMIPRWQSIIDRLPPYPTSAGDDPVVVDVQGATPINYNIVVPTTPVFPGNVITWQSPPQVRELFTRTLEGIKWNGNNSSIMMSIARARMSMPGTADWVHETFKERDRPNGTLALNRIGSRFNNFGHFTEQFPVTMVISELLIQSVGDVIRLLPAWPLDRDARFTNLRTQGGFLVTAQLKESKITQLEIESTVGGPLQLLAPWSAIQVNSKSLTPDAEGIVTIETQAGKRYVFTDS